MRSNVLAEAPVMSGLTDIFRSVLNQPDLELTLRTTADDVLGWDSMTHIALMVEAECRFGIAFEVSEVEALHSVGELLRAIETKRRRAA